MREVPRGRLKSALFDFDGTLSLIRQGWQEVMVSFMIETLVSVGTGESEQSLRLLVEDYVTALTGKQTMYQMIRLTEEIEARGGRPLHPLDYKRIYHERLWGVIRERVESLRAGQVSPSEWLVTGAEQMLQGLAKRGVRMYLASGTDEVFVLEEAALLGIDGYFEGRIYGALDDYRNFSKKIVIARILRENGLRGPELVSFGDGYVEIENTRQVNGIAVGVATDETGRCRIDPWKRRRLMAAGADLIVADFRPHRQLLDYLDGSE